MKNSRAMVLGSFIGDALALGPHWIYDVEELHDKFGVVDGFTDPPNDSYHPNKKKGGFTHYGDQTFILLESLAKMGKFDLQDYLFRWQRLFTQYNDYLDHATKDTMEHIEKGVKPSGSGSEDISAVGRIAPLLYLYEGDDMILTGVRELIEMTHNNPLVIDTALFFAKVTSRVLHGKRPVETIKKVMETAPKTVKVLMQKGLDSAQKNSIEAINHFRAGCSTSMALPGVIHLIAKYEDSLKDALVNSVMAGGDNAARAAVVGMVLGAHLGEKAIPREWISGLQKRKEIESLLDKLN
ncbi:ADP-ribosylglycohydrolase family protein [Candidatus Woesearchaeota archaeon]|nr:ADP-ribosylglycohydrolase family protein [Candidatus Woesearchaeota archaeon]